MKRAAGSAALAAAVLLAPVWAAAPAGAAGDSSHFTLTHDSQTGRVVHWARCTRINGVRTKNVIDYKVNPAGHRARIHLVKRGIRKLHRASGLSFRYRGTTGFIPQPNAGGGLRALDQRRATHVDLVVAWANQPGLPGASRFLDGLEQGKGSIAWSYPTLQPAQIQIVEAAVVMQRSAKLRPGFHAGGSVGTLLLHELGHAVGLQHYADPKQLMNPFLGVGSPSGYAAGDRAGLRRVGSDTKCLTSAALPPSN